MNTKSVLLEANKLVSNGLRNAAIELLLEYLATDFNSSTVNNALGRVYLLDKQPEKAVVFLKKSLEISKNNQVGIDNDLEYQPDDFGDDDMGFIESQADESFEDDFDLESDELNVPAFEQPLTDRKNEIHVTSEFKNTVFSQPETPSKTVKITYKVRKIKPLKIDDLNAPVEESQGVEGVHNSFIKPIDDVSDEGDQDGGDYAIRTSDVGVEEKIDSLLSDTMTKPVEIKNTIAENIDAEGQLEFDEFVEDYYVGDEQVGSAENYDLIPEELFEDEGLKDEGELDDLSEDVLLPILEEESEVLSWDDFEGLDEYDDSAHREKEEVIDNGKISREDRAKQIAVEVLNDADWDSKYLNLLQVIFIENGWSAARRAIEREILKGLTPEELVLARKVRLFWVGNEQFWTTFQRIKRNATSQQASATYKNMSWVESLRIIRCFPQLPDIEEVYSLIYEAYDLWYTSNRLRRSIKVFFKFLKYRTGSMRGALSGECPYYFIDSMNADTGVDAYRLLSTVSPEREMLIDFGCLLSKWKRRVDNTEKIKEEAE